MRRLPFHGLCLPALVAALLIGASPCDAAQVKLQVGVTNPTMLAGQKETNYVRISLAGIRSSRTTVSAAGECSVGDRHQRIDERTKRSLKRVTRRSRPFDVCETTTSFRWSCTTRRSRCWSPRPRRPTATAIIKKIRGIECRPEVLPCLPASAKAPRKYASSSTANRSTA